MWKTALAGAFALAITGSSVSAQDGDTAPRVSQPSVNFSEVNAKLASAKAALRLTPEQARHWPRVEAILRDIVRRQSAAEEQASGNAVYRLSARAADAVVSAASIRRLISAAQPLIRSLDDDQKRNAITMARAMGLGHVAASFE
jgi:zinc resistance-associated protein